MSRMNLSGHVSHVTTFSCMFTIVWCLVVGLWLVLDAYVFVRLGCNCHGLLSDVCEDWKSQRTSGKSACQNVHLGAQRTLGLSTDRWLHFLQNDIVCDCVFVCRIWYLLTNFVLMVGCSFRRKQHWSGRNFILDILLETVFSSCLQCVTVFQNWRKTY